MSVRDRPIDELPTANWQQLGQLLARFEEAWRRGEQPVLDDYLAAAGSERSAALVELIHTDLEQRLKGGEPVRIEGYLQRYPELDADPEVIVELITAEHKFRCRSEPGPEPGEYLRRFPQLGDRLGRLLDAPTPPPSPFPTLSGADTAPSAAESRRGLAQVPGYRIVRELGRGGMGVVYQAYQERLKRLVALKMIVSGTHAGPEELRRFSTEAEAAAQLQHPHIVQIYEVGEQEGLPFFVLELVEGGSLAQQLAAAPLPAARAAAIAETLARAIQYAHEHGIIHRDLKPSNILLTAEGQPKITDFGLAKQLQGASDLTPTGAVLGTPSYMAPEQASGRHGAIGPATDLYALGAVLYEMLTGRPPFRATTPLETVLQGLYEEPVPPRRLQPRLPRDLETLCLKCLQKEPRKRYASAALLANDLGRFRRGEPIQARPASVGERAVKWARRRPAVAALAAALAFTLAGGFLGMAGLWLRARDERNAAYQAKTDADAQRSRALEHQRLAQERLLRLQVANGSRLLDDGDYFAALAWFVKALEEDEGNPVGQEPNRVRVAAILRHCPRLVQLWGHHGPVGAAAFSPDGRRAVTASDDGTAQVWDVRTGRPVFSPPLRHAREVVYAAFSPDGRRLVTASSDQTAGVWDAASGRPPFPALEHAGEVVHAAFSPDGRRIVTASVDQTARLWDALTGRPICSPLRHDGEVRYAAFSPDGLRVITASADHTARVWDAVRGQPAGPPLRHQDEVRWAAFSPDGRRVVTASDDQTAQVWDAARGRPVSPALEHNAYVLRAVFSPDGRRIVTASGDQTARVWDAASGQPLSPPLKHNDEVRCAAFSPDGRRVVTASGDQTARVWDAASGQPLSPPLKHNGKVWCAAFSPDGGWILTASGDHSARVWDTASTPSLVLKHEAAAVQAAFSPDGQRLVTASGNQARVWDAARGQPVSPPLRHEDEVRCAAFSPDGRRVVTASVDQTARVWDAATGQPIGAPLRHEEEVRRAAFSPEGRSVVTASGDRTARVWDAASGQLLCPPLRHNGYVLQASFSPDGRHVVTAGADGMARVWDVTTGQEALPPRMHAEAVLQAVFSPDGRYLVTASSDRTARVWDAATGQPMPRPLWHNDEVRHAAFSPDNRYVVTASGDRTARVWDAATGRPVSPPLRHAQAVVHAAFSSDGRYVVTASQDQTARVWDTATGEPVAPPLRHNDEVRHAAFSPDSRRVVTAGADQLVQVWDLHPDRRPLADLVLLSQLLTGYQLDSAGGIEYLPAEELGRIWETLRVKYPDDLVRPVDK